VGSRPELVRCVPGVALTFDDFLQQGDAFFSQQRWLDAVAAYAEAVRLEPQSANAWQLLAAAQQNAQQFAAAEKSFERCLALEPERLDASVRYGFLLDTIGQPRRAIELLQPALAKAPQLGIVWVVLGHSYRLLGEMKAAIEATRRAIQVNPGDQTARYQLADLLLNTWELDECEAVLNQLLTENPNFADAWALLGICLRSQFRHPESIAALQRSVNLVANRLHHSKLVVGLQYVEGVTAELLQLAHQQWNAAHGRPATPQPPPATRSLATGRLRLGFVSADFARHPIGFLLLGALEAIDKDQVEIVCYADRVANDEYTTAFRAVAKEWREIHGLPDDQVANRIRSDSIDILFDLAGHYSERFGLFAFKPAAIQITWLGYVGTTGLAAMDYLIADRFHVPPGEEHLYSERVLRMPHGYVCYRPPASAPEVGPLPALTSGNITFGCFNNPAKYSPSLFGAWSAILAQMPTARLLLKFGGLDQPSIQNRVYAEFARRGIDSSRILFEPMTQHFDALAAYNRVDLALDTQPYSGGLTTCESLWMGVPVITFPGQTFAGRHSTSHLANAGFGQFIAADWKGYVKLALDWAAQPTALAQIRAEMRQRVRNSPLCDCRAFAPELLTLLRSVAVS
jgi:protein O-GlcNAc transferase